MPSLSRGRRVALATAASLALVAFASLGARAQAQGSPALRPEEPLQELPILTWQDEQELHSTVRQVIFNVYLPFLARPTFYKGAHDDAVPNQVGDWNWHRAAVRDQLLQRADGVDRQRRGHAGLPDAEVNSLIKSKQAFRPEDLEPLLTSSPRIDDLIVTVRRVQPLGAETFRVDFDVKTKVGVVVETTSFDAIDIVRSGGTWLLPTRILLEIAPLAKLGSGLGGAGFDPIKLAGSFIAVAQDTVGKFLPIPK